MLIKQLFPYLFLILIFSGAWVARAQRVEKIFVNLYTDSLKKGTYNYINIDGKMSDGTYLPLDSSAIDFSASDGKFIGNTLYIPADFKKDCVKIKATLRSDPVQCKEFTMYVKKASDPEKLKTVDEIMNDMKQNSRSSRKKKS